VVLEAPEGSGPGPAAEVSRDEPEGQWRRPRFGITLATVLLPVVLMMGKALVNIFIKDESQPVRVVFDVLGAPLVALLIAVVVASSPSVWAWACRGARWPSAWRPVFRRSPASS